MGAESPRTRTCKSLCHPPTQRSMDILIRNSLPRAYSEGFICSLAVIGPCVFPWSDQWIITLQGEYFLENFGKIRIVKGLRNRLADSFLADLLRHGQRFSPDSLLINKLKLVSYMIRSRGHSVTDFTWLTRNDIQILRDIAHGARFLKHEAGNLIHTGLVNTLANTEYCKITKLGNDFLKCLDEVDKLYRRLRADGVQRSRSLSNTIVGEVNG